MIPNEAVVKIAFGLPVEGKRGKPLAHAINHHLGHL